MQPQNEWVVLAPDCSLKRLEEPYFYDIANDELYELSEDGFDFLVQCSQGECLPVQNEDKDFIQYCLTEKLITLSENRA